MANGKMGNGEVDRHLWAISRHAYCAKLHSRTKLLLDGVMVNRIESDTQSKSIQISKPGTLLEMSSILYASSLKHCFQHILFHLTLNVDLVTPKSEASHFCPKCISATSLVKIRDNNVLDARTDARTGKKLLFCS